MKKLFKNFGNRSKKPSPMEAIAAEELRQRKQLSQKEIEQRMARIEHDFRVAFAMLKGHTGTVSFFGTASRLPEDNKYYMMARELASRVVDELGLTVVSGGGPGIMEAANRGAYDAKGDSVGMAIQLPREQQTNHYVTRSADFYYFFSRKMALTFTARAYVYFPGGFGTMDELFEILNLQKTGKIPKLPVILIGKSFWQPLHHYMENFSYANGMINKSDLEAYHITDDLDEALAIIAGKRR